MRGLLIFYFLKLSLSYLPEVEKAGLKISFQFQAGVYFNYFCLVWSEEEKILPELASGLRNEKSTKPKLFPSSFTLHLD